jgi:hypothetical protein
MAFSYIVFLKNLVDKPREIAQTKNSFALAGQMIKEI